MNSTDNRFHSGQFVYHPTGMNSNNSNANTFVNGLSQEVQQPDAIKMLPEYRKRVWKSLEPKNGIPELTSYWQFQDFCDIEKLPSCEVRAQKALDLLRKKYPQWEAGKNIEIRLWEAMIVFHNVIIPGYSEGKIGKVKKGKVFKNMSIGVSLFSLGKTDSVAVCFSRLKAFQEASILGAHLGTEMEWTALKKLMPSEDCDMKYQELRELLGITLDGYVNRVYQWLGRATRVWCDNSNQTYIEFSEFWGTTGDMGQLKEQRCQARFFWTDLKEEIR